MPRLHRKKGVFSIELRCKADVRAAKKAKVRGLRQWIENIHVITFPSEQAARRALHKINMIRWGESRNNKH